MAQEQGGAQGTGPEGSQGVGGDQGSAPGTSPAAGAEGSTAPAQKPPQYVTPEILDGVNKRLIRSLEQRTEELVRKNSDDLTKQISAMMAKVDEIASSARQPASKGDGGKGGSENAAQLLDLEKKLKASEERIQALDKARQDAEERERDYKFRTKVEAALTRNQCVNSSVAFLAIKDYLDYDPETEKITAKVKDNQFGLGDIDVPLEDFIKGTFREEILPQLFSGRVRPGAPASGDNGSPGGNGKFDFRESDLNNMSMEKYAELKDKIEEARKNGRIQMGV